MIKTKLTALTLAGLMAVASGAAFAESTTTTPVNPNATKLPGNNTEPMDRTSSETPGAKNESKEAAAERAMKHDKTTHGTHDKDGVTEKSKTQ